MNRIDRLFAILLHLQNKRRVRAQDLADKFEISKRTVYRDLSALAQSGVPLYAQAGEGYTLIEGFYLPPLVFTPDEASALFLGTKMLTRQAAGSLLPNAEYALEKIRIALPVATRQEVERMAEIIEFITPQATFDLDDTRLINLQKAILEKRAIHLKYHSYSKDETSERIVEPHQLFYSAGVWYFSAFCRLRKSRRDFRLDRVEELRFLEETFKKRSLPESNPEKIMLSIRFQKNILRWVYEQQHYSFISENQTQKGVEMFYAVHDLREITP